MGVRLTYEITADPKLGILANIAFRNSFFRTAKMISDESKVASSTIKGAFGAAFARMRGDAKLTAAAINAALASMGKTAAKSSFTATAAFGLLTRTIKSIGRQIMSIGRLATFAFATLFVGAVTKSIKKFIEFDEQMTVSAAKLPDFIGRVSTLGRTLRDMGQIGFFGATQLGDALKLLSTRGLSTAQSMDVLREVTKLVTIAGGTFKDATDIVVRTLFQFGKGAGTVKNVVTALALADIDTAATLDKLNVALRFGAAGAKNLGLQVNQTVAALTFLVESLGQGGIAGRIFRQGIVRIPKAFSEFSKESNRARAALESLGITQEMVRNAFTQNAKGLIDLEKVFALFQGRVISVDQVEAIFGIRSLAFSEILSKTGSEIKKRIALTKNQARADEVAGKVVQSLSFQLKALGASIEEAGLRLVDVFAANLKDLLTLTDEGRARIFAMGTTIGTFLVESFDLSSVSGQTLIDTFFGMLTAIAVLIEIIKIFINIIKIVIGALIFTGRNIHVVIAALLVWQLHTKRVLILNALLAAQQGILAAVSLGFAGTLKVVGSALLFVAKTLVIALAKLSAFIFIAGGIIAVLGGIIKIVAKILSAARALRLVSQETVDKFNDAADSVGQLGAKIALLPVATATGAFSNLSSVSGDGLELMSKGIKGLTGDVGNVTGSIQGLKDRFSDLTRENLSGLQQQREQAQGLSADFSRVGRGAGRVGGVGGLAGGGGALPPPPPPATVNVEAPVKQEFNVQIDATKLAEEVGEKIVAKISEGLAAFQVSVANVAQENARKAKMEALRRQQILSD